MSGLPRRGPLARPALEALVRRLVDETGRLAREVFLSGSLDLETKDDDSPVTRADREAESLLRRRLREAFPDHGLLGEEHGAEREDAEHVWVLDPIDGTRSFVAGCPLFGTLIGLLHDGRPVFGALHAPMTDQLLVGDGETTTLNGRRVSVRDRGSLADALILATDLETAPRRRDPAGWKRLMDEAGSVRTWGDCWGYLLVATGGADVMLDARLEAPWDRLPLLPLLEGAGAVVSGWNGEDALTADSLVAAGPRLHRHVLDALAGSPDARG